MHGTFADTLTIRERPTQDPVRWGFVYMAWQCLKQKFCLNQSTDRRDSDPGDQGTFYNGHKITVVIWHFGLSKDLSTLDV